MAGVVGAVAGGALGGAAMIAGPAWALRLAFVVFVVGTVQAIRLPARVDSSLGEVSIEDTTPIPVHRPTATAPPGERAACELAPRHQARLVGLPRRTAYASTATH